MMPAECPSHSESRIALGLGAAVCLVAVFTAACDPPGKPEPVPPPRQDITDFETLYGENCAGCHGVNGRNGPARPLNNPLYLAVISRQGLQHTIENGRPGTAMPAWLREQGGPLTSKQITALVDGIEQHWAKPASFHGAQLPSYSVGNDTGDAGRGRKLFARDCFMCHGQPAIGSVTDKTFLQLVTDQVLRTSIIVGRDDIGRVKMPDYRSLNMGHPLSNQDIADIVAYLASLRPNPPNVQNAHTIENESGQAGQITRGNEGSGHGPGSPRQEQNEGNKGKGSSSQRGGK